MKNHIKATIRMVMVPLIAGTWNVSGATEIETNHRTGEGAAIIAQALEPNLTDAEKAEVEKNREEAAQNYGRIISYNNQGKLVVLKENREFIAKRLSILEKEIEKRRNQMVNLKNDYTAKFDRADSLTGVSKDVIEDLKREALIDYQQDKDYFEYSLTTDVNLYNKLVERHSIIQHQLGRLEGRLSMATGNDQISRYEKIDTHRLSEAEDLARQLKQAKKEQRHLLFGDIR